MVDASKNMASKISFLPGIQATAWMTIGCTANIKQAKILITLFFKIFENNK
jgi:hypothetical protein